MKRYLLPALFSLLSAQIFSQTVSDVLKYSYLRPTGTARYLGVGGAMGALGADFGTLSGNPAGLALFRSDEVTVTPGLKFARTDATLPGNETTEEEKSTFGFDNLGLVFNTTPRSSRWKTFNVGLGFNRQNNYNQALFYQGEAQGTIMNGYFQDAQSVFASGGSEQDLDPFGSKMAWDANAIYFQDGNLTYDFADAGFVSYKNSTLERSQALTTFGSMNEMVLSFAGNYNEQLMVGFTLGVPFVNYRLEGEYVETETGYDTVPFFDALTYTEFLRTEGIGVNLKLGVIYKINQILRLGVAVHTPTALSLTDTYSNTFAYDFTDGNGTVIGDPVLSPEGVFDYKLRTPWRAIASAGVVLKKYGFISADVEWVDYGANRYNFSGTNENEIIERGLNTDIQRAYQQTMNIRVGGELALDQFRLRAGVNLNGKPKAGEDGFTTAFSAGAGVRTEAFFLDLGYRRYTGKGSVTPYIDAPTAVTGNTSSDIALTLGFKF